MFSISNLFAEINDLAAWAHFFVAMTPHLSQSTPIFEATIYCLMTRTQFSNHFKDVIYLISTVLNSGKNFWITSVPTVCNHPLSRKNLMFQIQTKNGDIRHDPIIKWPIKPTYIDSPDTRTNFPAKSIMIYLLCISFSVTFLHIQVGFPSN